ncbi:hypothetical protein EMCG_08923 [[Emmonsia] crescens]|uniref:Uncharacterized protein n=1 Tax=[Emmonsia] crescens TaxID=73230 RepID=A0A0G2I4M8_9EURO|nr:hypothetical protein EMCG_08923 [Emmonsia crescens UAMH 3008]
MQEAREAQAAKLTKKARKKRDNKSGHWDEAAVPPTGVEMCGRKGPQLTEYSKQVDKWVKQSTKEQERSGTLRRAAERLWKGMELIKVTG